MTDVPPGSAAPGSDPEHYVPSGARRSSFTPPPDDAEPPAFDDDALADALAAEVSSYTSPIPVSTGQQSVAAAPPEEPLSPPDVDDEPPLPPAWAPAPEPAPEPAPAVETSSATLEAIERLESELRRRAEERAPEAVIPEPVIPEPPHVDDRPFPDSPLFPAPPTFIRSAPPDGAEVPGAPDLPSFPPPTSSEPLDPPFWDSPPPPNFTPPPLVEPPTPTTGSFPMFPPHPETPAFGVPPVTPPVDLPPPGTTGPTDFAHLPPPIGLEPAAIPPYDPDLAAPPTGSSVVLPPPPGALAPPPGALAPPPGDFAALLTGGGMPAPHPDDLGHLDAGDLGPEPAAATPYDDDDVVDEIDRAFGTGAIAVDSTGSVGVLHPPSEPIPTVRLADDEHGIVDAALESHPALLVETAGVEPTALDLRAGRAARLFWLWFATNSSVVSLSLGAVLFGLGMSLRQTLIAIVVGVAISFLPLGLGTLAGKWSGQPTMVVSRASFGLVGNVVPTLLAVISRVFWGGALLWMLATGIAQVLVDAGLDAGLGEQLWTFVGLGVGFVLAFVVAIFGYGLVARVQLVLSILTGILVVGVIVITSPHVDLATAQSVADGAWNLLLTGIVLVFSVVGLAWVHSSADVARYQRTDGDGGSSMLWATFGATLPAFLLIGWGALLAASDPLIAEGLATDPLHTIAALLPIWYPAPLLAALALGLLSAVVLTIYSGGFAIQALGVRARRSATTAIAGVLVLVVGAGLLYLAGDVRDLIRDVATTIAVPVAAWAGIFGAEMIIRSALGRRFDGEALLRRGGVYPAVRWVNLIGLLAITALGFGLTSALMPGLSWQGYLWPYFGLSSADPLLTSDIGVLVALALGILLPLITAIPGIRRQERVLDDDPAAR